MSQTAFNSLSLKFTDPGLEYKFTRIRLAELPLALQVGLGFLVVLYMTLAISQSVLADASIVSNVGYAALGVSALIAFSFLDHVRIRQGSSRLPEYLAGGIVAGTMLVGLLPGTHLQLHVVALLVTLVWYWLFSGFSFNRACIVGWPLIAGGAIIWLFFSNRTPAGDVLLLVVALLVTALFATLTAYLVERRWRLGFLLQHASSAQEPAPEEYKRDKAGSMPRQQLIEGKGRLEWAQSLKAMTIELAAIHETDLMFLRLLEHLRKQVRFDAAAVGVFRDGCMAPVIMRDQLSGVDHEDAIKMLWTGALLDLLQSTRNVHRSEAELGLLESSIHGDGISFGYRLDVPYFSQRRLNGVVTLLRKRPGFNDFEVNFASSMIFHGMFAQRSARLQQRLERLTAKQAATADANVPSMTATKKNGLLEVLSADKFIERADVEFNRLTVEGKPVSLLLIEIDHHEELAKKYGEGGSKEIFAAIVNILQNCLNEGNLLGRYGSGSFAVQLPMSLSKAQQLAEGLRYTIEACALKLNGHKARITVSIGVSCFGNSASDFLSMLRSADLGLFLARDANGNTVRVSN